jgi:hypothetical protein
MAQTLMFMMMMMMMMIMMKTKGSDLMQLFTATGKLKKFF